MTTRPDWADYFLGIARAVSARADCTRRTYGAVLVKNNRIVSSGYNGAPAGAPGCLAGACPRGHFTEKQIAPYSSYDTGPGACISVHAEANALLYADHREAREATLYLWSPSADCRPCDGCTRLLKAAGVIAVVTPDHVLTYLDRPL